MRLSHIVESVSTPNLLSLQLFGILRAGRRSNYMRERELTETPILAAVPGPWGVAIAMLRASRGLSQKTVAKRAKMTATTYGRIERGFHTQTRKLQDIAEVFGVPIERVLQHSSLQSDGVSGNTALSSPSAQVPIDVHHRPVPAATLFNAEDLKAFAYELGKQFSEATAAAQRARPRQAAKSHRSTSSRDAPVPRKRRSR